MAILTKWGVCRHQGADHAERTGTWTATETGSKTGNLCRGVYPSALTILGILPFIQAVARSHKKWAILTNAEGHPRYALDTDKFLCEALLEIKNFSPWLCCHVPIIVVDHKPSMGEVILRLKNRSTRPDDEVIDKDVILVWGSKKRIITGADILGRLLRGVTTREAVDAGMPRRVKHMGTNEEGQVIACCIEEASVEVGLDNGL